MQNKKNADARLTWLRILLFTALAYGLLWIFGYCIVDYETMMTDPHYQLLGNSLMFAPAAAMALTRLLTREREKNPYLHLRLRGNMRYYWLAAFLPVVYGLAGAFGVGLIRYEGDIHAVLDAAREIDAIQVGCGLMQMTAVNVFLFFIGLGEEAGWRAYLYPKLKERIGTGGSIVLGGIIWGAWHAPLTIQGHNFGTDYPGFPYLGILLMCLSCIFIGAFYMWLTERSGSVIPAAVSHSCNNGVAGSIQLLFVKEPENISGMQTILPLFCCVAVIGAVFLVLMLRRPVRSSAERSLHAA